MTVSGGTPQVLQLLFSRGVPRPLAELSSGSCAALSENHLISVYDSDSSPGWTLTAQARWPEAIAYDAHPWAALAPCNEGVVLLNMSVCDVSGLPVEVVMSLKMQQQRYTVPPPAATPTARFRISVDAGQLRVAAPWGTTRVLPIGAAYTVTAEAFQRHEDLTFSYLSVALRVAARAISDFGPLTTDDLLHRLHPAPTVANKQALNMSLTRLRRHPRILLERLADGRLTITQRPAAGHKVEPAPRGAVVGATS